MQRVFLCVSFLLSLLLGNVVGAESLQAIPAFSAHIVDTTGVLSESERQMLESRLAAFEGERGSQIAVLLVPSIAPETIEQYSLRVAEAWHIGRTGISDGALLLIALQERKLRIEVGYGLEGSLSDAVAKRIISDIIAPHFKEGRYFDGISAGVGAMIKVIGGENLPARTKSASSPSSPSKHRLPTNKLILGAAALLAAYFLRAVFATRKSKNGVKITADKALMEALVALIAIAFILFPVLGVLVFLVEVLLNLALDAPTAWSIMVMVSVVLSSLLKMGGFNGGSHSAGSWVSSGSHASGSSGSWSSSSSDSGGSSSSDFGGGGGGSFGGGGASGDW